jgi:hypothetical protein
VKHLPRYDDAYFEGLAAWEAALTGDTDMNQGHLFNPSEAPAHPYAPYLGTKDPADFLEEQASVLLRWGNPDALLVAKALMGVAESVRDVVDADASRLVDGLREDLDMWKERAQELEKGLPLARAVLAQAQDRELTEAEDRLRDWLWRVE